MRQQSVQLRRTVPVVYDVTDIIFFVGICRLNLMHLGLWEADSAPIFSKERSD
jgi:hypothetical protein